MLPDVILRMQELADQLSLARKEGGAFLLPSRLVVRVSGADAFRYLNGQVTRDLGRLRDDDAVSACLLTPRGKLCAVLLIHREGEDFLLEADPSLEESLPARLERYIVADDVTLSLEKARPAVHLFGRVSTDWVRQDAGENNDSKPPKVLQMMRLGVSGIDVELGGIGSRELPPLLDPLVVEALRLEHGIPSVGSELGGEILPPEALLDRTHIDYDRACYPGQEVISRLKSIGRVNRLLHLLTAPAGSALRAGMHVASGEGKDVGVLTSVAEQFDTGATLALAFLPRESSGPLFALDPLTGARTQLTITSITGS